MGRFSPSISAGPSWTQGLAEGAQNIAQALMQRRAFQQQQNQQDISNAENGVYRGNAPQGSLNVTTPDYQINDQPGGSGPQVMRSGGYSATNTANRPLPGGISALNPMTDALLQSRAQSQAPGGVSASFDGPDGKGLVDTQRYQQITTKSGQPYYLDREQTPDAQALRRSVVTGEMGFNRALQVQALRNAGLISGIDERGNQYAPGGQHYEYSQDAIGARGDEARATAAAKQGFTQSNAATSNGYFDANGTYQLGTKAAGQEAVNAARPHYAPAGRGASAAANPTARQFNAVGKQITQTNAEINQTTRQLNAPSTMLDANATNSLQQQLMDQRRKRDSLTSVGDSLSGVMQRPAPVSPSGAATALHVPRSGTEASTSRPAPQGAYTPMDGNRTNQSARTVSDRLPSAPTDASNGNSPTRADSLQEASRYQSFVSDIQNDKSLSAADKNSRIAKATAIYNSRLAAIKPQR